MFVAMPYGTKEGLDFNVIYNDLIRPALKNDGFTVFRADEEMRAGDIRRDMFQELLIADIVVADLTINNPNVWYELGVRHALRKRGVILVGAREGAMPFDIASDRTLRYRVKNGVPDPEFVEHDRARLADMARETVKAWYGRVISPVYELLPYLEEPNWKTLEVGGAGEFWSKQRAWTDRVSVARRKQCPGDILVLAEEAPIQGLRLEAYRVAARALRQVEQFEFALEQIEHALEIAPDDIISRQEKGMLLGRIGQFENAKEWLRSLAHDHPTDAETCGLLGRVEKDEWINAWRTGPMNADDRRVAARENIGLLREALDAYAAGFRNDATSYYCGINAVTLLHLHRHLVTDEKDEDAAARTKMEGGVVWAATSAVSKETPQSRDFWARVTLADLTTLRDDPKVVEDAYKYALAVADKDWFSLNSTLQQLTLLAELGVRPDAVDAAMRTVERAIRKLEPPFVPRRVFLFTGHMIDAPDRPTERFPEDMTDLAKAAIENALDRFGAQEGDLALCEGACGGDLLFARAALDRKLRLHLRLPFDEPTFLRKSVSFAGPKWRDRYFDVKAESAQTRVLIMPAELGPTPEGRNDFERSNLWQLYSALAWGPQNVRVIALWNGEASGKRGGTDHMIKAVESRAGQVEIIDTKNLLQEVWAQREAARRSSSADG